MKQLQCSLDDIIMAIFPLTLNECCLIAEITNFMGKRLPFPPSYFLFPLLSALWRAVHGPEKKSCMGPWSRMGRWLCSHSLTCLTYFPLAGLSSVHREEITWGYIYSMLNNTHSVRPSFVTSTNSTRLGCISRILPLNAPLIISLMNSTFTLNMSSPCSAH